MIKMVNFDHNDQPTFNTKDEDGYEDGDCEKDLNINIDIYRIIDMHACKM